MILYGTGGKHFATCSLPQATCPVCQVAGHLRVGLVSRYAHVYWVPLFPYQKIAVPQCTRCGHSWEAPGPPALAPALRQAKRRHAHPYWTWSGVLLLALLGLGSYLASLRDHRNDEALLAHPLPGDIYTVHSDSARAYSLLKVLRAGGNGVELVANKYQTTDSDPIHSLNEPRRYSQESFVVTRLDLQIMRRRGELTDVDRP